MVVKKEHIVRRPKNVPNDLGSEWWDENQLYEMTREQRGMHVVRMGRRGKSIKKRKLKHLKTKHGYDVKEIIYDLQSSSLGRDTRQQEIKRRRK